MNSRHGIALILSVIFGHVFYQIMEASLPTETNCSYMASPITDLLAFIWGFAIVYYGFRYDNAILTVLGATIVVEHIYQLKRK
jgi:hypothetical protein